MAQKAHEPKLFGFVKMPLLGRAQAAWVDHAVTDRTVFGQPAVFWEEAPGIAPPKTVVKWNESPIQQNCLACLAKRIWSWRVLLKSLKRALVQGSTTNTQEHGSSLLHQHLPPCPQHVPQTTQNHTAQEIARLPTVPPVLRKLLPLSPQSTYAPTWQIKRLRTVTWKGRRNALVGKVKRARRSRMFQCVRFV